MEIKEFIEKKSQLESKLNRAISDVLQDFERETGLTPSFIMVNMENVSTIGDEFERFIVTKITTEFDFL